MLLVLLLVATFYHAALGLQVVIEDYIHGEAMRLTRAADHTPTFVHSHYPCCPASSPYLKLSLGALESAQTAETPCLPPIRSPTTNTTSSLSARAAAGLSLPTLGGDPRRAEDRLPSARSSRPAATRLGAGAASPPSRLLDPKT